MDRNVTAGIAVTAVVLGVWLFTSGNETLAESSVKDRPLMRAAYAGDVDALKRILAAGAAVNEVDPQGWTALHHAVSLESHLHYPEGNHVACVQVLLKAGADPNAHQQNAGEAPLYRAVYNPDLVEALLAAGANPNYGVVRRTPVISATYCGGELCTAATESIRLLLKAGAEVNAEESGGFTALSTAAVYACPGMVRTLIEAGAKVDHRLQNGQTLTEWVKMAQQMHQGTLFGGSWKPVHDDNLRLLYAAASNEAGRR